MPQYRREGQQKRVYSNSPKRDKSGFVCWVTTDGSNISLSPNDPLPSNSTDLTLQAVWDSNYYVVSFKNSDGTLIEQKHGYYGTEYEVPAPPKAPDGYVFFGWGETVDGIIRGNATYTAQFIDEDKLESAAAIGAAERNGGCKSSLSATAFLTLAAVCCIAISFKKKK